MRTWQKVAIAVGVWGAIALFFSLQNAVGYVARGEPVDWVRAMGVELLYWVPWALLTPALLALARRFPITGEALARSLAAHLAAALALSVVQVAAFDLLQLPLALARGADPARFMERARAGFPVLVLTAFWKYWVLIGVYSAFQYYRKYRDRELRASRLEAELTTARLETLKMRIQPHFLFNTLHSISMLSLTDTEAANRVLMKLSRLLRETLESGERQEVPLARELELVDRYLEIERLRFGDRLAVEYRVKDGAEEVLVPSLVLQPLVENAVRHGLEGRASGGRIEVRARERDGRLELAVVDDGAGLPPDWSLDEDAGIGLRTTAARVAGLYGDRGGFTVAERTGGGTSCQITIPWQTREAV